MSAGIDFTYLEVPPTKWTFEPPQLKKYVESKLKGRVLNLFAGETKLRHYDEVIRVDIDENRDADLHINAMDIDSHFVPNSFDTVILDPPYNIRKSREKYNQELRLKFTIIKDKVMTLVSPGGRVITFGYDSTGMSKSRGFKTIEIALLNHKGAHNDTICHIEERTNGYVTEY